MPLLPWMKKTNDKGEEHVEVKLDDDTQKKLDTALAQNTKMDELVASLKGIQAYVDDQKKEREDAAAKARAAAQAKTNAENDEELQTLILTDPKQAILNGTRDQSMAILMLRADQLKRDVFDDADRFSYYAGEVKSEIDKLLANQSIQNRNDPSVIENCYYTVLGKHAEEAREGKLKSRFASVSGTRGTSHGAAGGGEDKPEDHLEINDDIRKAARITGISPEDYAKMLYKEGVGYV